MMAFGDGFNCEKAKCKNELAREKKAHERQSKTDGEKLPENLFVRWLKGVKMFRVAVDV